MVPFYYPNLEKAKREAIQKVRQEMDSKLALIAERLREAHLRTTQAPRHQPSHGVSVTINLDLSDAFK